MDVEIELIPEEMFIVRDSAMPGERSLSDAKNTAWMDLFWHWDLVDKIRAAKGWYFYLLGRHGGDGGREILVLAHGKYLGERW